MIIIHKCIFIILFFANAFITSANTTSVYNTVEKLFNQCNKKPQTIKCLKIQALKIVDRALHIKSLNLIDGFSIISENNIIRDQSENDNITAYNYDNLNSNDVNKLLLEKAKQFINSRKLQVNFPHLIEEGRKKKDKNHYGLLMYALALKGTFFAMAYKGIAVMAGTALIVGKIALLLSAILGLKKLVTHEKDKTTFEIVKHPKYSESHTHSSSYEDDSHYRRSLPIIMNDEFGAKTSPYQGYLNGI